jgi:hypothetical protein
MNYFLRMRRHWTAKLKGLIQQDMQHAVLPEDAAQSADSLETLEQRAARFPSMGSKEIGSFLRKLAREAPVNTAIVEVGSWLGAGTAQLALGIRDRGADRSVKIYSYDRWKASAGEVEKASRKADLHFSVGDNTLPWVMDALKPFGVAIEFVRGDIAAIEWAGGPISVYVDDASKAPSRFDHVLRTFGPSWIPGVTILVMMDYHYWEKSGSEEHKCQKYFMEAHPEHFKQMEGFRRASNAAFLYCKKLDFERLDYNTLLRPAGA